MILNTNDLIGRAVAARPDADAATILAEVWRMYGGEVPLSLVVERMALRLALQQQRKDT